MPERTDTEKDTTTIRYAPKWKDSKGNVILLSGKNNVFEAFQDAHEYQIGDFIFHIPFGLSPDGILEIEMDEQGMSNVPHVRATLGMLGDCAIIVGPEFDMAVFPKSDAAMEPEQ